MGTSKEGRTARQGEARPWLQALDPSSPGRVLLRLGAEADEIGDPLGEEAGGRKQVAGRRCRGFRNGRRGAAIRAEQVADGRAGLGRPVVQAVVPARGTQIEPHEAEQENRHPAPQGAQAARGRAPGRRGHHPVQPTSKPGLKRKAAPRGAASWSGRPEAQNPVNTTTA